MKKLLTTFGLIFIILPISIGIVSADEITPLEIQPIDKSELTLLYDEFLSANANPDENLIEEIEKERFQIRSLIEKEIWTSISDAEEENIQETSELIEMQSTVVDSLQKRLVSRRADLTLVQEEVRKFYQNGQIIMPIEDEDIRFKFAEFLANEAALEERIALLEVIIPLQDNRLQTLQDERQKELFQKGVNIFRIVAFFLLILIIHKGIQKLVFSRISNYHKRYAVNKTFSTVVYTLITIAIVFIVFAKNPNILASLAIVGAGLVVALQDVVKDIVGWFIILQGKYKVGDRITINGNSGSVVDIGVLQTTLLEIGNPPSTGSVEQQTGKTIYLPNSMVLQFPVLNANTTSDYIKSEMSLMITLESDWKKAKDIITEIVTEETDEYTQKDRMQYKYRTSEFYVSSSSKGPEVFMKIGSSGVEFTLRFDRPIGKKRHVISTLSEKILDAFEKEKAIELAYPTSRIIPTPQN